jgi:hypothetical protein
MKKSILLAALLLTVAALTGCNGDAIILDDDLASVTASTALA